MTDAPSSALKALRDNLREQVADVGSLIDLLQACLTALGLRGDGPDVEPSSTKNAIQRYLPSIQIHLLTDTLPNFIHALDEDQLAIVKTLFVPAKAAGKHRLKISRWIALTTTLTLPPFLNAAQTPVLPIPSRGFMLDILSRMTTQYGIDQLYWAVWSESSEARGSRGKAGAEQLMWEEAVKSIVSVPAKCANAVGRWKSEGWPGEVPTALEPR